MRPWLNGASYGRVSYGGAVEKEGIERKTRENDPEKENEGCCKEREADLQEARLCVAGRKAEMSGVVLMCVRRRSKQLAPNGAW